jgi:hypothetical protein
MFQCTALTFGKSPLLAAYRYDQMLEMAEYFFRFLTPQNASVNSNTSPITKYIDGSPSNPKLSNLPKARPPMKIILVNVAIVQNLGLDMPIIQIEDIPRYNPIIALRIFVIFIVSTLMSNSFDKITFGFIPYTNAIGIIKMTDIVKCRFLIVEYFF